MQIQRWKASLIELLGTFTLVFVGASAGSTGEGMIVGSLAHGGIVAGLIYTYGSISGAHINPTVTAALLLTRHIDIQRALLYWLAQFGGGIAAAALLNAVTLSATNVGQTTGSLTAEFVWTAAIVEGVLTFFLVSVIYQAAVYGRAGALAGFAIGFTLIALILAGAQYTGASLNPARTLGPALIGGDMSYVLPYFVGIFGGGLLAGLVQHGLIGKVQLQPERPAPTE